MAKGMDSKKAAKKKPAKTADEKRADKKTKKIRSRPVRSLSYKLRTKRSARFSRLIAQSRKHLL